MDTQYITLEQWRALIAVVDTGGYAQAAEKLHKSQSSVTYAVQKIESLLGVKAFEIQGRKAILTPTGQFLYRRARALLEESASLERAARRLSAGWEAEIRIAAEIIFPTWLMLHCLGRLSEESPHTRVELIESVLGGTTEALLAGQVDMAITGMVPPGFLGMPLMRLRFIPVASPDHPLHQLGRPLTMEDFRHHRHLVVRESGTRRDTRTMLDTAQRWTVSNSATSIEAVRMGYGFAWMPEEKIRDELHAGSLKPLALRDGGERFAQLYLVLADPDSAGPGTRRLAEIVREAVQTECVRYREEAGA
ncbi:MAG TPA: LysR family transcriptional regulator [Noviherbaspirillum sp.]|uniref:LysR family transcriptional regulator n=1 Tax=Noviherbaspirillum sp. TaxID=1926288 RepID=UPI002D47B218|nr:LysR family transcriptional regulator [Noviherbaspirillum sp.]HYD94438.1 LysR family transcriptional regulator [Noviherbaspirillum sp.]